jgi:hypothetical protein
LPNGDWITLSAVHRLQKYPADEYRPEPTLIVAYRETSSVLNFSSLSDAQAYADELAGLVNAAKGSFENG